MSSGRNKELPGAAGSVPPIVQLKEIKDGKKDLILHELRNYECFYSRDISDVFEILTPLGITKKEIEKVYNENKDNENKNN